MLLIGQQLGRLSPDRPTSFDDLVALNIARNCVDELFRACVDELSADPQTAALWSALASASELSSKPAPGTKKYGAQAADSRADKRVRSFWRAFGSDFTWDFLPVDFLHALYTQWLRTEFPKDAVFSRETFSRRLKATATSSSRSTPAATD